MRINPRRCRNSRTIFIGSASRSRPNHNEPQNALLSQISALLSSSGGAKSVLTPSKPCSARIFCTLYPRGLFEIIGCVNNLKKRRSRRKLAHRPDLVDPHVGSAKDGLDRANRLEQGNECIAEMSIQITLPIMEKNTIGEVKEFLHRIVNRFVQPLNEISMQTII